MKQSFARGALILATASFINRAIGFLYRILIVRLIGPEGIGLYQMAFPAYALLLVLTTAGIPMAVAKLVAEKVAVGAWKQARQVLRLALWLVTGSGLCFAVFTMLWAPRLAGLLFADPRVSLPFVTMLPALIIVAASSVFRGFFFGLHQMLPPAVAQVAEQVVRFSVGLYLVRLLLPYGLDVVTAGMAVGMIAGELVGLVLLILMYWAVKKNIPLGNGGHILHRSDIPLLIKAVYGLAIPITLSRVVNSMMITLEAILIPQRLQVAGFSWRQATEIYGHLAGIASMLVGLPTILTVSLATTMIPAISDAAARQRLTLLKQRSTQALRITIIMGIPAAAVLHVYANELTTSIFHSGEAAIPLRMLALGAVFFYLQQTTAGILQGLGKVTILLVNTLIAAVASITGVYYLTAVPQLGIVGTAVAFNFSGVIGAGLNLLAITRITRIRLSSKKLITIIYATVIMVIIMIGGKSLSQTLIYASPLILSTICIMLACLVYLVILGKTNLITVDDLNKVPFLKKFSKRP